MPSFPFPCSSEGVLHHRCLEHRSLCFAWSTGCDGLDMLLGPKRDQGLPSAQRDWPRSHPVILPQV